MGVSRSSYYDWKNHKTYQLSANNRAMKEKVEAVFWQNKRRYGFRRVAAQLNKSNTSISLYKVRKLMAAGELKAIQPRSFVPKTTNSRHSYSIAPNLLKDMSFPRAINQVWVGDITYIPMADGSFHYLSVWMDLCSRKIVGWELQNHMRESLVRGSLQKALSNRKVGEDLIVHSDRGGQYGANELRRLLAGAGIRQSMSDKDNPYDNAHMESCFSRLKAELMQRRAFRDAEHCRAEIFEFIEMYYNPKRLHSSLGYLSPNEYEKNLQQKTAA